MKLGLKTSVLIFEVCVCVCVHGDMSMRMCYVLEKRETVIMITVLCLEYDVNCSRLILLLDPM